MDTYQYVFIMTTLIKPTSACSVFQKPCYGTVLPYPALPPRWHPSPPLQFLAGMRIDISIFIYVCQGITSWNLNTPYVHAHGCWLCVSSMDSAPYIFQPDGNLCECTSNIKRGDRQSHSGMQMRNAKPDVASADQRISAYQRRIVSEARPRKFAAYHARSSRSCRAGDPHRSRAIWSANRNCDKCRQCRARSEHVEFIIKFKLSPVLGSPCKRVSLYISKWTTSCNNSN